MLSLSALITMTNRKVVSALSSYRLVYPRTTNISGWRVYTAIVYGGSKPAHPRIRIKEDNIDAPCEVGCSCTYFQMNFETALAVYGSAQPLKAGGAMPKQRNPQLKPGLCPHLLSLGLHLSKQWADAATTEKKPVNV